MNKTKTARVVSRITTWTLRALIALTILFFVAVIITATMGGKGDVQRQSLESVASQTLGLQARIHDLRMYRIFPQFHVDLANFEARRQGQTIPVLIIERALFTQDLWPRLWGAPAIAAAELDHLVTQPGLVGPYSLHLTSGRITGGPNGPSFFYMVGTYAGLAVNAWIPLERSENGYVRIDGAAPVKVQIGDMMAEFMVQIQKDVVVFSSMTLGLFKDKIQSTLILPRTEKDQAIPSTPIVRLVDGVTGAQRTYEVQFLDVQRVALTTMADGTNTVPSGAIDRMGAYWRKILKTVHPLDENGKPLPLPRIEMK